MTATLAVVCTIWSGPRIYVTKNKGIKSSYHLHCTVVCHGVMNEYTMVTGECFNSDYTSTLLLTGTNNHLQTTYLRYQSANTVLNVIFPSLFNTELNLSLSVRKRSVFFHFTFNTVPIRNYLEHLFDRSVQVTCQCVFCGSYLETTALIPDT